MVVKDGIRTALVRELDAFSREVEAFPSDEFLWQTLPGVTNSVGNLALHVAGNLRYFIGVVLGGSDFVRDREAEFARRSGSRDEVLAHLREARETVNTVLSNISDDTLDAEYPEPVRGHQFTTGVFLIHVTTHIAHHLGQAGYLRRLLTGENRSVSPISIPILAAGLKPTAGL